MKVPTIGVVITAYRRREFLPRALLSLAQQTSPPDRVVIVMDDPPYNSLPLDVTCLNGRNIPSEIHNHEASTAGDMIAEGILACSTDIVAFLDDDDRFDRDKICNLRLWFEDPERGFVHNAFWRVRPDGSTIDRVRGRRGGLVEDTETAWQASGFDRCASAMAIRRAPVLRWVCTLCEVTGSTDTALAWLALRADLRIDVDPNALTTKICAFGSAGQRVREAERQHDSMHRLLARSRPGSREERFARWVLERPRRRSTTEALRHVYMRLRPRVPRQVRAWLEYRLW